MASGVDDPQSVITADSYTPVLILDPRLAELVRAEREKLGQDRRDEVWEGVYVVSPVANNEHQRLAFRLAAILQTLLPADFGEVYHEVNVSDREKGWEHNFREPDVAVFLRGGPGRDCGTHWCGGPDFAVEIVSPGDAARSKLTFYEASGVRELMIVDRNPWTIDLYRRTDGRLSLVKSCKVGDESPATSEVVPATFRLIAGEDRPLVEVASTRDDGRWTI